MGLGFGMMCRGQGDRGIKIGVGWSDEGPPVATNHDCGLGWEGLGWEVHVLPGRDRRAVARGIWASPLLPPLPTSISHLLPHLQSRPHCTCLFSLALLSTPGTLQLVSPSAGCNAIKREWAHTEGPAQIARASDLRPMMWCVGCSGAGCGIRS